MRGHFVIAGVVALATSACSLSRPSADEKFAQQALQAVRNSMKDPTSVKFKDVTLIERGKCAYGEVLGKNGFGAYAGYQKFVYTNGEAIFDEPGSLADFTKSPDQAMSFMNKQMDCSNLTGNTLPEHVLHIPEA